MPARKKTADKKVEKAPSFFDYFRFGESYTSLMLGILAVIIATGLLLGFVNNRNIVNKNISQPQVSQSITKISQTDNETIISTATESAKPTATPTPRLVATKVPKLTITLLPTKKAVAKAKPTVTLVPTKKPATPTIKPTVKPAINNDKSYLQGRTYTVKDGDTLWSIAEKNYGSGYNWVDIARANKLSNPNSIKVGDKLVLPKAEQKNASSEPEWRGLNYGGNINSSQVDRITGTQYIVKKGDNLWNIAVRAYGDGYQWVEIARANNLPNPNLIYPGTTLKLPRK